MKAPLQERLPIDISQTCLHHGRILLAPNGG
jgi:hypothetical protein